MSEQELEQAIHDYIMTLYKAEYKGLLEVNKKNSEYIFKIGLPSYMQPTSIAINADTDEEFLDFIKEELRVRNYMRLYIYKVTREERNGRE